MPFYAREDRGAVGEDRAMPCSSRPFRQSSHVAALERLKDLSAKFDFISPPMIHLTQDQRPRKGGPHSKKNELRHLLCWSGHRNRRAELLVSVLLELSSGSVSIVANGLCVTGTMPLLSKTTSTNKLLLESMICDWTF